MYDFAQDEVRIKTQGMSLEEEARVLAEVEMLESLQYKSEWDKRDSGANADHPREGRQQRDRGRARTRLTDKDLGLGGFDTTTGGLPDWGTQASSVRMGT